MRTIKIINIDIKLDAHSHEHECDTYWNCHSDEHRHLQERDKGDVNIHEAVRGVGNPPPLFLIDNGNAGNRLSAGDQRSRTRYCG